MKGIVRDDIISLDSFVAAEFKYKKYLEILKDSGCYCFLDEFKKLVPKGQSIVNGMIENNLIATENINKNYKYIYLTDTAMKYVYLRDSDEDFSTVTKNRISVRKVNKNPSEKQLFSSSYKFHLLINGEENLNKASILNDLEDYIFIKNHKGKKDDYFKFIDDQEQKEKVIDEEIQKSKNEKKLLLNVINLINRDSKLFDTVNESNEIKVLKKELKDIVDKINEINTKIIKTGLEPLKVKRESIESKLNILENKCNEKNIAIRLLNNKIIKEIDEKIKALESDKEKIIYKKNNIKKVVKEKTLEEVAIVQREFEKLYDISKIIARIKDDILEFIIFDNGTFKEAYSYLKLVNKLNDLKLGYKGVNIIIYSYAEHRAENLYNEFIKAKNDKEKALKKMRDFNMKVGGSQIKSDFYIAAEKIYDNTPEFEVKINNDFYYMGKYKDIISSADRAIKKKDKKAIDQLIDKLKQNN
ncbi:MAG: hypothetical protein ACRDB9_00965 [Cetobacterium sp.]